MDDIGLETIAVSAEGETAFADMLRDGVDVGPEDGPIKRFWIGLAKAGFDESDCRRILRVWLEAKSEAAMPRAE